MGAKSSKQHRSGIGCPFHRSSFHRLNARCLDDSIHVMLRQCPETDDYVRPEPHPLIVEEFNSRRCRQSNSTAFTDSEDVSVVMVERTEGRRRIRRAGGGGGGLVRRDRRIKLSLANLHHDSSSSHHDRSSASSSSLNSIHACEPEELPHLHNHPMSSIFAAKAC